MAQATKFTLASEGCSKKHCNESESDAVGLSTPSPSAVGGSLSLYTPAEYMGSTPPNPISGGDDRSDGCSSNGTIVVCKRHTTSGSGLPHLKVYGASGDMIFNSCGGTDPVHPNGCDGNPEKFDDDVSTALIGTDNSFVAADSARIIRFYSDGSFDRTKFSEVSALDGVTLSIPQGAIYTEAPDGSGGTKGLITLLFQYGPVVTFDPGNLGSGGSGFIGMWYPGAGATFTGSNGVNCDQGTGACFYAGTNSACATQVLGGEGDSVSGGRIYEVANEVYASGSAPTDAESYQGRLYALNVTTSGVSEAWYYDFVTNGILGPSGASPGCPGTGQILTDYGAPLQSGDACNGDDDPIPGGTSCGAGVLNIVDCTLPLFHPLACGSGPYATIYQYPIANLPTDVTGTMEPNAGTFFNANFSFDPTNDCMWVRPYATETMSCVSTTTESVVEAINVGALALGVNSNWSTMSPDSNVPIATSPTNASDSLAILGASTSDQTGNYCISDTAPCHALLAIDTGVCSSPPCCTSGVSYGTLSCPTTWSTAPVLSWYFDISYNGGGSAPGQAAVVNDSDGDPCLVAFTDYTAGTWLLSAPSEGQGGCAE